MSPQHDQPSARPPVRTFKPRRRPLSPERSAQWDRLAPRFCLPETGGAFDAAATFGRSAPLVLDIGIGAGESTLDMALADPTVDVIGVDVHTPGIAASLARIDEFDLSNVRLVHGDALVFAGRLPPGTVHAIRIYFPDPWPKARHRHRRITTGERVGRLVELLAPGGTLHVATDIDDYVATTQRACDDHPDLAGGVIERPPWRPTTRYERKGLAAGRTATDLLYTRVANGARHHARRG